eukprot:Em0507g4a
MFTRCDGVQVQEYDDEMVFYSGPKLRIDYYKSEAYSKYITRVLPLIAEHDEPSFLKLQEIIKMVLAAEWFKEKGIQMSEKWMENCACCKETAMSRTSTDNSDHSQLLCEIKNSISRPRQAVDISMRENEREQSGVNLPITTTVRESTHDWDFVYQGLSPQRPMMPVPEVSDCPQSPDVVSWNELYSQTVPWPRVWISSSEGPGVLSATGGVRTDTIPIERVACCDGSRRPADRYSFVVEARIQGSIETVSSKEVQQLFRKEWTGHEKGTCPQIHGIFAVKNAGLLQKWNRYKDALTNKTVESYFHGTTLKCDIKANNTRLCQFSNCGICGIVNEGFSFEHIKAGGFQRFDR